jgi:hypothetical protein
VRGTPAEGEHRRVDLGPNVWGGEELSHARHVAAGDGTVKRLEIALFDA